MKCIAIDDEPLALELIEDFCSRIDFLQLVSSCTSAIEAIDKVNTNAIDLVFVDINMPRISGLDFVKSLAKAPLIIFTTAYSEHAAEGFNLDAVDYLVKPIPFDRFLKAANKAKELFEVRKNSQDIRVSGKKASYIMLKADYKTIKVELKDILYIEGVKDYVKVVIKGQAKSCLPRMSMKAILEKLPNEDFIRVHRSYIISLSAFQKVERDRILIGKKQIPIGETYRKNFYDFLDQL